jgi:hypothetical protein
MHLGQFYSSFVSVSPFGTAVLSKPTQFNAGDLHGLSRKTQPEIRKAHRLQTSLD